MQTQVAVTSFYAEQSRSPSLKIAVRYPQSISNLSYNFQLQIKISKQKLLPKISYEKVYDQAFYLTKKQILVNNVEPASMYKVEIEWTKKGTSSKDSLNQTKVAFCFTDKVPQHNQNHQESQSFTFPQQSPIDNLHYGTFVKENIHNYFDEYYHNDRIQPQENQTYNSNNHIQSRQSSRKQPELNIHEGQKYRSRKQSQSKKAKHPSKASLCNSEMIVRAIGQSDSFINKKNLERYILEGRNSSSVKDYLTTKDFQCFNSFNKTYKNQTERRKHVEKTLLVTKAINMFGQIYDTQKELGIVNDNNTFRNTSNLKQQAGKGKQFFKNDWFMGPFYSYDANQKKMTSQKKQSNQ